MASWNSLPYELKLKIAEHLIDLIIVRVSRTRPPLSFDKSLGQYRKLYAQALVRPLMEVAPELQKDLAMYCRKLFGSNLSMRELMAGPEVFLANSLARCLETTL